MRLEFARSWVRFPAVLRCVFSSDPAVSSSIFVGAEREENLISSISMFSYCCREGGGGGVQPTVLMVKLKQLRHGIQTLMEAILACHPALSTK